jgi:hypothetical protein
VGRKVFNAISNKVKSMATKAKHAEHDLLSTIVRYIVPVVEKKAVEQKDSPLEEATKKEAKTKEKHAQKNLKEIQKSIDEIVGSFKGAIAAERRSFDESFSYSFHRKTLSSKKYSVEVKYHGTTSGEKIDVRFSLEEDEETETTIVSRLRRKEKKEYSFTLVRPREQPLPKGYHLDIAYHYKNGEEVAQLTYTPAKPYIQKHIEMKNDFTEKVPLKPIHHMWPESIMGGVLGFTYIGENFMGRRDDLVGWWARMVDIHESIHTPDEYETRVLTDWIMEKRMPHYPQIPQFLIPKADYKPK